jgi:hypothetical protein
MRRLTLSLVTAVVLSVGLSQTVLGAQPVRHQGSGTLLDDKAVNFDSGVFNKSKGNDFKLVHVADSERLFTALRTASFVFVGSTMPRYSKCKSLRMQQAAWNLVTTPESSWFCFKTAAGRFGRFQLGTVHAPPNGFQLLYTTWEK